MTNLPRPVLFVKYYDKGSTVMGADQISEALRAEGVDARSVHVKDIEGVRGALLVFIKTSRFFDLWRAKRRGNAVILDVQDTICFKRRIKNRLLFHGHALANVQLAQKFKINGYPSMIFLASDGKETDRAVGGYPPEMLVPKMKKAVDQKPNGTRAHASGSNMALCPIHVPPQCLAHDIHRRGSARPNLQGFRALMEQHAKAVGHAASGGFGRLQQRRFRRPVNHVINRACAGEREHFFIEW